jgi:RNA polymerase II subunit A small phosphatase-like protein
MGGRYDKLLVLDLDETLVHTVELRDELAYSDRDPDIWLDDGMATYERPGVREFLASCFANFQAVGLWTAGTLPYALELLPHLCEPDRFAFVWGRERCTYRVNFETHEHYWVKDIQKLRGFGFPKTKILCVDDSPEKFERSYGNYVYMPPFEGDPEDTALEDLRRYLDELGAVPNVRSVEKRGWRQRLTAPLGR